MVWEDAMAELCQVPWLLGSEPSSPFCQAQTKMRVYFSGKKNHRGVILVRGKKKKVI